MIIITGASGGIGSFLVEKFDDVLEMQHRDINLTSEIQVSRVARHISELNYKNITLIHCAGYNHNAITSKMDYDEWKKVLAVNLDSAFLLSKHLIPIMREQNYGRIIFMSSVVPHIGVAGTCAYSAAKMGLLGLMRSIVKENATKNITCNTLTLGYFNTGMIKQVPEAHLQNIIESIPVKHLGDPQNIYNVVDCLMKSEYINGAEIEITGGL